MSWSHFLFVFFNFPLFCLSYKNEKKSLKQRGIKKEFMAVI